MSSSPSCGSPLVGKVWMILPNEKILLIASRRNFRLHLLRTPGPMNSWCEGPEPQVYNCARSSHDEKTQIRFHDGSVARGRLIRECTVRPNRPLAGAESQRLVRATAVAGGKQLRSQIRDQPVGDVAGSHLQSRGDREG